MNRCSFRTINVMTGTYRAVVPVQYYVYIQSMKKFLTISFLSLYAIFSIGLNIVVHTCGGESEALLATTKVEDPCGCADEMTTDKCCTTVWTTVQLDDTQKASITTINEQLVVLDILPSNTTRTQLLHDSGFTSHFLSSFSPPTADNLHILNSVFLI